MSAIGQIKAAWRRPGGLHRTLGEGDPPPPLSPHYSKDGLNFPSESFRKMNHIIVDQHRFLGPVVPVQHHFSSFCNSDGCGRVSRCVGQELTLGSWSSPVPIVEIDCVESHDAHFFTSHCRLLSK